MLKIFGDPNKHLQLMFACRWVIACLKVLHRLCSRSCILLRSHMPVFKPRWGEVVLEVYCFKLMVQKEKHQGNAVWYRGTGHWLHNSVQANKSHGSSHISTLLHSLAGWEMILDYLIGVKEVFQVEGKKEKLMFPWKTFFSTAYFPVTTKSFYFWQY